MPTQSPPEQEPKLPQQSSDDERAARAFQLSLARTAYNYMRTYPNLEEVALCAGVPPGEGFSLDYNALLLKVSTQIGENYLQVAREILDKEIEVDSGWIHLPSLNIVKDYEEAASGLEKVVAESVQAGPTAFLKSSLFDLLRGKKYLQAASEQDYKALIKTLPTPLMLTIQAQDWMPKTADEPCQQDWFFGYFQLAGFNTTNLRGVIAKRGKADSKAVVLSELQAKLPITDKIFQDVLGDSKLTLAAAVAAGKLFVCDYAALIGGSDGTVDGKQSKLHDKQRYLAAPIALFYWNDTPPAGYPPNGYSSKVRGVLQPIAIQLAQCYHEADAPIFTPNDCSGARDRDGLKWKLAKYFVNVACAVQHESVAHLGDCHMIVESVVVATHRQLSTVHPLYRLLSPHLRFTISINNGAINSLVVPGGVVATNIGPDIHWTLTLVNEARKAWRWDENNPSNIFTARGVEKLPVFPFRDDTLPLWAAIKEFVKKYVNHYYPVDRDILDDTELQRWIGELTSPQHANLKGFNGLDEKGQIDSREYLIEVVAQIIYIAGPQHASVNYGQYPLGAYMPSVSATIYQPAPTANDHVTSTLAWFPPFDVALYTISFEYLLSAIQYDRLGDYGSNSQFPYFAERNLQQALEQFQDDLAQIEIDIHQRNRERPLSYPFQLPSRIPNGISI